MVRFDFDVRQLQPGDEVELYIEPKRIWERGTFEISTGGIAYVSLPGRAAVRFDGAIGMGLRRVVRDHNPPKH
jgi:hypothetical protein